MKVYVKRDKVLKLLGEGKVFSKKDLILREFGGDTNSSDDDTVSINLSPDNTNKNPSQLSQNAITARNTVTAPGKKIVGNVPVEDVNGVTAPTLSQNDPGNDMTIDSPDNTSTGIKNAAVAASKARVGSVTVPIKDSVKSKKVMDEMRANSIPFTKSELTKFLKSL
jgi:hypothetical protein